MLHSFGVKTSTCTLALLLAVLLALPAAAQKEVKEERPRLLVMPLRPGKGLEEPAAALDTLLLQAVHGVGKYRVLGSPPDCRCPWCARSSRC